MKQGIGNFASTSGAFVLPAQSIWGIRGESRQPGRGSPGRAVSGNGVVAGVSIFICQPEGQERGREPSSELGTKCMIYTIRISALKGSIHGQTIFQKAL